MYNKKIARFLVIIGALLILLKDLLKVFIKGIGNIDLIDIFIDAIIFISFLVITFIIKKTDKD